jgi:hypothetical protein
MHKRLAAISARLEPEAQKKSRRSVIMPPWVIFFALVPCKQDVLESIDDADGKSNLGGK